MGVRLNGLWTLAWAGAPPQQLHWVGSCLGGLSEMLAQLHSGLRALTSGCARSHSPPLPPIRHPHPHSSAARWRDAPTVETLPSALLTGHFYYLGYLRRYLARCRLFAFLGEGKSLWSKWTL